MTKTVTVLSALVRPLVEPRLPDWVDARYFASSQELLALAPEAEIGWFDLLKKQDMAEAMRRAGKIKWLNTIYAGVDAMPLDTLAERGVTLTCGAGINAITIAEYVVMGMLNVAKGYRDVVRAQDRHEWLRDSPGKVELLGTRALIIGYGTIGQLVDERLTAFGVEVSKVRRTPGDATLGPDEWRGKIGEFDWIILAVPATPATVRIFGAEEIAAIKPSATLINIARGTVVDQDALVAALEAKAIHAAVLDVTDPEPLPAGHPLWSLPNAHITMHLSGRSQTRMYARGADRFIDNLGRYERGEPLEPQVNLTLGY